ncbi:CocE/NonD family hydrolase [Aspergillus stella-maris]|uniref:CocE/NonD family hydrolase n=1 Tax=Aspergillus stella-maris TaxID=1810926 RepID=UPI003CCDB12A
MSNTLRDLTETFVDDDNSLIFEKNVSIPLESDGSVIRCNVYRPKAEGRYPVLVTYGPYGKDIYYGDPSLEVNPEHKSQSAAWETPDPVFWTARGYAIVRADERGLGQSPGVLDTMSAGTANCFFQVVEWAADQAWSSGKVGLLGVSYYAGSQWRVAAKRPKGLACIVPWEGMSDYYRDRCRHGGIFSNNFISFWWIHQVITNQYGRPGRAVAKWGEDTIEGDLSPEELLANMRDQNLDNDANKFLDDEYYASKNFPLENIQVPLLSVANWGGISLHLRGNVEGYTYAGSRHKWLRFIVGRHDLPLYYEEEVDMQVSFLEAFLKDNDYAGWKTGQVAPVSICLRKGDVGFNNPSGEKTFPRRQEQKWPIARTVYTKYHLTPSGSLLTELPQSTVNPTRLSYRAFGSQTDSHMLQLNTAPATSEYEVTGHIVAHLNVSVTSAVSPPPDNLDLDLFVILRHLSITGTEIYYTGSSGDAVPVTKGWLRLSMRSVNEANPRHREYLPWREYRSTDVLPVENDEVYPCDVELWPTNVVVQEGETLMLEIASEDTQGAGLFKHNSPVDR